VLALCLQDFEEASDSKLYVRDIKNATTFLRSKIMMNIIQKSCPISSPTRWTGVFDSAFWFISHQEELIDSLLKMLEKPDAFDVPSDIIRGFTEASFRIFLILLPYKLLSEKLESERMPASMVLPLLQAATDLSSLILSETELFECGKTIHDAIQKRFNNSESGHIYSFLYYLTPSGRYYLRTSGDVETHGIDAPYDKPDFAFNVPDKFLHYLNSNISEFADNHSNLNQAFTNYSSKLISPVTRKYVIHEPDASILLDDDLPEIPIWFKEIGSRDISNFKTSDDEQQSDSESESNDSDLENESDYSESDDPTFELSELDEVEENGPLLNPFNIIEHIGRMQLRSEEEIHSLKTYYINWITADPKTIIPDSSLLEEGIKYWEILTTHPKHKVFANFVLPLLSIPASEAVI
jgi:hypothetical protein